MYTPTRFFSNINCFACQDGEKQAVFLLISNWNVVIREEIQKLDFNKKSPNHLTALVQSNSDFQNSFQHFSILTFLDQLHIKAFIALWGEA